jgi:SAM-dependent methyltransferase
MSKAVRALAFRALEVTGLIAPVYRRHERKIAALPSAVLEDGLPMPPAELMVAVAGTADQVGFSQVGAEHAGRFRTLAERHGKGLGGAQTVLDFGCGCGRIARWLGPEVIEGGGQFLGSDLNPRLLSWCAQNLPGRYFTNGLQPPLDLADGAVDLVYAYSVLTHLTEKVARAWLAEMARVVRPGGLALMSFSDETFTQAGGPPGVAAQLEQRDYVVWNNAMEGSNYMSAWTTAEHFTRMASPLFDVLEIARGTPEAPAQAIGALRRR